MNRIAIASDHASCELKAYLAARLMGIGYEIIDLGNIHLDADTDYPDFIASLALALSRGEVRLGIGISGRAGGEGVGANKVAHVRACTIHDRFSTHQGNEVHDLNLMCVGVVVGEHALAWEVVQAFLGTQFDRAKLDRLRLEKGATLEYGWVKGVGVVEWPIVLSHGAHQQTVSEAKALWRYEGNPN